MILFDTFSGSRGQPERVKTAAFNMSQAKAIALWHCCACGKEWRAKSTVDDDTECCPFAPKVLNFGTSSAWGHSASEQAAPEDDEECLAVIEKFSKVSTTAGSRSSSDDTMIQSDIEGLDGERVSKSRQDVYKADLEAFASAFAASTSSLAKDMKASRLVGDSSRRALLAGDLSGSASSPLS